MTTHNPIIDLPRSRLDEAVELLARAFENDPMGRTTFADQVSPTRDYMDCLRRLFRFACEVRLLLGWPLLGYVEGERLVAVMGITEPERKEWPASLHRVYDELKEYIGPSATARLESFSAEVEGSLPDEPHYFLGFIGVHPDAQGKGYGRALIEAVQALSEAHPTSTGVYLDTENPTNVKIYERCGYHVTAQHHLHALTISIMFRPNKEQRHR